MKKNLLYRLGKTLSLVEGCRCCRKSSCRYPEFPLRHPEFISGSQERKQMLKQVQHNDSFTGKMPNPVQHDGRNDSHPASHRSHPEFISGSQESKEMLKQVQHDGYSTGKMPNPVQYDDNQTEQCIGWRRTSFSLGRSMIEMLGVLAIIGVLSIGGLYAYRRLIIMYQASQTTNLLGRIHFGALELCNEDRCLFYDNYVYSENAMKHHKQLLCPYAPEICNMPNIVGQGVQLPTVPNGAWRIGQARDTQWHHILLVLSGIPDILCQELVKKEWGSDFYLFSMNAPGHYFGKRDAGKACVSRNDETLSIYWVRKAK